MELENSSKLIKELRVQHGISMTNSGIEVKFWANLVSNSCPSVHQRVVERWLKTKPSPDRYGAGVPVFVTFFFAATCLGPCLNWRNVSSWSHRLSITSVTIVSFPVSSWPYFFLFSLPLLRYLHRVCVCNGLLISRWRIQLKNGLCSYLSNWSHFHWIEICNIHLKVEGFSKWRWWFDFDLAETCAPTLNRVWWIFVDFFSLYGADAARKTGFFFFFFFAEHFSRSTLLK